MQNKTKLLLVGASMAAALGLGWSAGYVKAADLGGNCCADLEERVAELEATVARKGNRRVSVEIYGQVSKSILWVDGNLQDGMIIDNPNSPSRFGFTGKAKISPDIEAGYTIEYGAGDIPILRHNFMWLKTALGKVSLGHTSAATDGISEISVANTNIANLPSLLYGAAVDGDRRNVLRYDTPSLAGFIASMSWSSENVWDAALRYTGEGGGFRFAAGIGYSEDLAIGQRTSGSASLMHIATGMFINGVYGQAKDVDVKVMHVTGGIERKFMSFGATTAFAEYGKLDAGFIAGDGWGIGVVQAVDGLAMDFFASYRSIEEIPVLHIGSRIKF